MSRKARKLIADTLEIETAIVVVLSAGEQNVGRHVLRLQVMERGFPCVTPSVLLYPVSAQQ